MTQRTGTKWRLLVAASTALLALGGCASAHLRIEFENVPDPRAGKFASTLASMTSSLTTRGGTTGFWDTPDEIYAARLHAIRQARSSIHFETFYMTPGRRADAFAVALAERARAGVAVHFIGDSNGVSALPKAYWDALTKAGVVVRFYHPFELGRPFTYNTRTHRKLLLIDGKLALTGGVGVSDDWDAGVKGQKAPWADIEIGLQGPVVSTLEGIFLQHWLYVGGNADMGPHVFRDLAPEGATFLVTPGSPTEGDSAIRTFYHTAIVAARKRLWIASPYFLPDRNAVDALLAAVKRGVDVRILSQGPSNDQQTVYRAVYELYGGMLTAGIPIMEYQPSMMHAKVMLLDDWVVTGSANFDPRSFFHNDELLLSTQEPELTRHVEGFFGTHFKQSRRIMLAEWERRSLEHRVQGRLGLLMWWQL